MPRRGRHQQVYRGLLRLYPADYRQTYAEPMAQLFADQLRDEGPGRSWLGAMGDVPRSALSEHLRRNRTVAHSISIAPTPTSRILGVIGVIGGVFLLLGWIQLDEWTPDLFNLRLILFNLGAIAIGLAVYARQRSVSPKLALAGTIPVVVANAAYMLFTLKLVAQPGQLGMGDYQPINWYILTAASMWLGDAWFALVTLRLGVMNRWSALALLIGSLAAFAGMGNFGLAPTGSPQEKVLLALIFLHGVAWVVLGLELVLRRRMAPTAGV